MQISLQRRGIIFPKRSRVNDKRLRAQKFVVLMGESVCIYKHLHCKVASLIYFILFVIIGVRHEFSVPFKTQRSGVHIPPEWFFALGLPRPRAIALPRLL